MQYWGHLIYHHHMKPVIPLEHLLSKSFNGISQLDKNSWEENAALYRLPENTNLSLLSHTRKKLKLCAFLALIDLLLIQQDHFSSP